MGDLLDLAKAFYSLNMAILLRDVELYDLGRTR